MLKKIFTSLHSYLQFMIRQYKKENTAMGLNPFGIRVCAEL